jgi:hypothetical protein
LNAAGTVRPNPADPSTPSGCAEKAKPKATDHELQKHVNFTRYGQARIADVIADMAAENRMHRARRGVTP